MALAFPRGITIGLLYNNTIEYQRSSDEEEKEWGLRTDFVEHENETLALCFVAYLFPLPVGYGTHWHVQRAQGDIGLVGDFVQLVDLVFPLIISLCS